MTLSAKWTAVSLFALTSVALGSLAFAGCTVTSGTPTNEEGGTVITNPPPPDDSGTADAADAAVANTCEGNKQTSGDFFSPACQNKLNAVCCTELKTCFDIVPGNDDAGQPGADCNGYSKCIDICTKKADGVTPETDQAKIAACDDDCDSLSTPEVIDAYKAIVDCATAKASDVCQ
jgi:hypothetical protein